MDQGTSEIASPVIGHPGTDGVAPKKKSKTPRAARTYRAARRNAPIDCGGRKPERAGGRWMQRYGNKPAEILDHPYRGSIRLNRSRRWTWAPTYARARELSPSTEIVR